MATVKYKHPALPIAPTKWSDVNSNIFGAACLSEPTHQVVFHSTPTRSSWMNQSGIWLSILVRKLLKHGSFMCVEDLQTRVLVCIENANRSMAKPFESTNQGKALRGS